MSRVTRREWYERVNAAWPATVPALTGPEALRAARRLYRYGTGRTWKGPVRLTSGNRSTWIWGGEMVVNPEQGWHELVHLLSHLCERSGHNASHARMELRMIKQVVKRGWLDGRLKDPPAAARPPRDVVAERHARVIRRVAGLERRIKSLTTRLKTARRQLRYYERKAAAPAAAA